MTAPIALAESGKPALVTAPSLFALRSMGPGGPFGEMPTTRARQVIALSDLIAEQPDAVVVSQYHRGDYFYLLLKGQVKFQIAVESAGQALDVGSSAQPWTPIGWSAFRAPQRYATTVKTAVYSEFLRFRVADLLALFDEEPETGWFFFQSITRAAGSLLEDARELLVENLRPGAHVRTWDQRKEAADTTSEPREGERSEAPSATLDGAGSSSEPGSHEQDSSEKPGSGTFEAAPQAAFRSELSPRIASEESMVTNAAPQVREVLRESPFFESFPAGLFTEICAAARIEYFCRGQLIRRSRSGGADMLILADGQARPEYTGTCGRTMALRAARDPGDVLSWASDDVAVKDIRIRATRDGSLLRFSRSSLKKLFSQHPKWGYLFQTRVLWLLSGQLRQVRVHLVSETFEQEVLAVDNLLEQVRTELRVSSPLHKLPHLIRATVTLTNAMSVVDAARRSNDELERHTANICHELLEPVRRESRFFSGLQAAFEEIVAAPDDIEPKSLRRKSAESFIRVFSQIPTYLEGLEHLPQSPGNIFVFNHLRNHDYNTLPNGFQLTLDSHFISSMILHKTYGDPGVRVVRLSRAGEYAHHAYYSRLGHVSVYTRESDLTDKPGHERFRDFVESASTHLARGENIVIAPEGTSRSTSESPGIFKAGAFRLAAAIKEEPLIIPIAMANFDRRLARTTLVAKVQKPFRVSDVIDDPNDGSQMNAFLSQFQLKYRSWVEEVIELAQKAH